MKLGQFELLPLSDGCFRLDGGSMFGIIPKNLWERLKPADGENRIRLGLFCLLVKTPEKTVLIEAGIGEKMTEAESRIYGLERPPHLLQSLEESGFSPEEVDYVVLSHLHLDHCGWATRSIEGHFQPTFPRALYVIQAREWEAALRPDRRSLASYDKRDFEALEQRGRLILVDGEAQLCEGIWVRHTGGHTQGHQIVYMESGGERCVFLGDLVPTFAHIKLHWHMAWDLFPLELLEVKERVLQESVRKRDLLFFTHEETTPFAYLEGEEKIHLQPFYPT
jgi:glyoxylase-like metal-dependent hydrolase (beta-lactamase superfamily II)